MAQNYTPITPEKKAQLDPQTPPVQPQTIKVSPESAPITINKPPAEQIQPQEAPKPDEQAKEEEKNPNNEQQIVEERPEDIELPPELKNLGLKAVAHSDVPDYQNIQLPISDEKIILGEKAPITSSARWLAEFAKYLLWKAHITLKTVHGRVIRVLRR